MTSVTIMGDFSTFVQLWRVICALIFDENLVIFSPFDINWASLRKRENIGPLLNYFCKFWQLFNGNI